MKCRLIAELLSTLLAFIVAGFLVYGFVTGAVHCQPQPGPICVGAEH